MLSKANSCVGDVASVWYLPTQGASVRQYIGAPMSPAPIGNADQTQWANNIFFVFGPPLLLAQGASVRQ